MEKVYNITQNLEYSGKISFVNYQRGLQHLPFEEEEYISYKMGSDKVFDFPKIIPFAADYTSILKSDFLQNSLLLTIVSKKMLEILLDIASFKHQTVPLAIYNDLELEAYHIEQGARLSDLKERNDDYVALQLMEFSNFFDYDKSEYEMSEIFEGKIDDIDKLVLKQPKNGFPSLFKIKENRVELYVSEQAKNALEQAGINGCVFEEVEVSS